jgi:arylsulfatase A-like enzyme
MGAVAGGVALAVAPRAQGQPDSGGSLPNIVLCMADDQGWGDVGYNGHPLLKTPHLDEAAAQGLRFDRFYAAAPVCSPTRGSVLTGRHPNRFGCFTWGHTLRPQEITLPEALKQAGYVTGHFGKWHLGSVEKGSPVNPGANGFDEWFSAWNFYDNDPIFSREGVAVPLEGESSMVTVDAALAFMRKHAGGERPFLAVVWFGSPHKPHRAAEEDRALYADEDEARQHFLGEISGMDRAFGKLRGELRALGIHENTLLWYCSDNGGLAEVGATGGRGHKGQLYEGGLRVPAFLEWPRMVESPRTTEVPCNTSDIYPTLVEIAGVAPANQPPLDGVSLGPLLRGALRGRRAPMGFWVYPAKGVTTPSHEMMTKLLEAQAAGQEVAHPEMLRLDAAEITARYEEDFPGHAAWLNWPWKLHQVPEENSEGGFRIELYNLVEDPEERRDVAEVEAARVEAMRGALALWQQGVVASLNGRDYV